MKLGDLLLFYPEIWGSTRSRRCLLLLHDLSGLGPGRAGDRELRGRFPCGVPEDFKVEHVEGICIMTGWWFGTWLLFSIIYGIILPIDFHIFQDGWNHQPDDVNHFMEIGIFWSFGCWTFAEKACCKVGSFVMFREACNLRMHEFLVEGGAV